MLGSKTAAHFQQFRLPRYSTEGFQDSLVELQPTATSKIFQAEPINFSKHGLAFRLKEDPQIQISPLQKINSLRFRAFGKTFFDGEVEVKHATPKEGNLTVGVFTKDKIIEIEEILGAEIGDKIIYGNNSNCTILKELEFESEFKLYIADYRDYLTSIKNPLDKAEKEISLLPLAEREKIERGILKALEETFRRKSDEFFKNLNTICKKYSDEKLVPFKVYFQSHLHDLLLLCPFGVRSVNKPLGYPGDYEMMNMIYGNHYRGESLFAKLENRYWCTIAPARANMDRLQYLKSKIQSTAERVSKEGKKVKITSLGSGPAKEIFDFIETNSLSENCIFTCVDLEPKALACSKLSLTELTKQTHKNVQINYVLANVVSYLRSRPPSFMLEQDLIYASGLYDYLKLPIGQKLTELVYPLLRTGGELLLVNASVSNPCKLGMEFAGEWYMNHRTKEEMLSLVSELKDYQAKNIFLDKENVYWFLSISK